MKKMRKIAAIMMAILMALAATAAWAGEEPATSAGAADFDDGVAGAWTAPDTEIPQEESINIKKDLKVYNPDSTSVFAPEFSYVYTVTPASVDGLTVTDAAANHDPENAVTAPVQAGITEGLVVTGTTAGTAGTATSATGTLVFTNDDTLTAAADGAVNSYDINLDFSGVTFTKPGVYRYEITETLADGATYAGIAVEDSGSNARYLDVYVDGDLKIYGYVCMAANGSVTTSTAKTDGFTDESEDGGTDNSDHYYTYDLTLSKDVVNDNYAESNIAFPFTVIFNNSESYTTNFAITETVGTGSTGITPTAGAPTWSGVAEVKEGGAITYTGIPAGVDVDVYETNSVTGVTYKVSTSVNSGTAVVDASVTAGSKPSTAVAQADPKADYESTVATVDTPKIEKVSAVQTVEITNELVLISPTGYVARFAPYALMLIGGVVLLIIAKKHKKHSDEE